MTAASAKLARNAAPPVTGSALGVATYSLRLGPSRLRSARCAAVREQTGVIRQRAHALQGALPIVAVATYRAHVRRIVIFGQNALRILRHNGLLAALGQAGPCQPTQSTWLPVRRCVPLRTPHVGGRPPIPHAVRSILQIPGARAHTRLGPALCFGRTHSSSTPLPPPQLSTEPLRAAARAPTAAVPPRSHVTPPAPACPGRGWARGRAHCRVSSSTWA